MANIYVKSDGNGGVVIGKTLIALIGLIVVLISTIATVVAYNVGVSGDVKSNNLRIVNNEKGLDEVSKTIDVYGRNIASLNTNVDTIKSDISEMKKDIKELLKHSGG